MKRISDSAIGRHSLANQVKLEIKQAEDEMTNSNYLFPVTMGVYLKANNYKELRNNQEKVESLLNNNGFQLIIDDELYPIDAYIRNLPFCYNHDFDKKNTYRSKYVTLADVSSLLPFFGRSKGSGFPATLFFNRGGEPYLIDRVKDKTKNAHMLLFGETGTGKSNLLNFLVLQDLALYNGKFFIIEAGGSFNLLADYLVSLGLAVNRIKIDPAKPISLNPFADALKIVEQLQSNEKRELIVQEVCERLSNEEDSESDLPDEEESRDILGEMVIATLLMITGGEAKEEKLIRRSDRMLIIDTIIDAVLFVKEKGENQLIATDIIESFDRLAQQFKTQGDISKLERVRELADAMRYFTTDVISKNFFNTYGNPWESADVTIIDLGIFAREGYEAQRSLAFAGIISKVLAQAEANQAGNRAINLVCDENHLITSIPLLATIQTRVAKMGRKLGLWLWLATQNMQDFSEGARRLLSQIEFWICLALPPDEIDQIEKFKSLTHEQRLLFLTARKEAGKYTEGVIMCPKLSGLFRNVPPRLFLALAATEQKEKNLRKELMKKHKCSEIEAVEMIAKEMMNKAGQEYA